MNDWASRIGRHMTAEGSVVVPARIAAWLEQRAGLTSDRRIRVRDTDPAAYEVLMALHAAALDHRSGTGTKLAVAQPTRRESETWLTTTEAASATWRDRPRSAQMDCQQAGFPPSSTAAGG